MSSQTLAALAVVGFITTGLDAAAPPLPKYEPDPYWPKHLPNNWHGVGEVSHIHSIAADSKGNIYLGEVDTGRRAYRWSYKGSGTR